MPIEKQSPKKTVTYKIVAVSANRTPYGTFEHLAVSPTGKIVTFSANERDVKKPGDEISIIENGRRVALPFGELSAPFGLAQKIKLTGRHLAKLVFSSTPSIHA